MSEDQMRLALEEIERAAREVRNAYDHAKPNTREADLWLFARAIETVASRGLTEEKDR